MKNITEIKQLLSLSIKYLSSACKKRWLWNLHVLKNNNFSLCCMHNIHILCYKSILYRLSSSILDFIIFIYLSIEMICYNKILIALNDFQFCTLSKFLAFFQNFWTKLHFLSFYFITKSNTFLKEQWTLLHVIIALYI